jgi:chemotaxis protein methyltransferase CheR
VDPETRERFLKRVAKNQWRVNDSLQAMITWRHFNLTASTYTALASGNPFHLVLCRNVLIYFNFPTIERVINNLYNIMAPQAYLMLGYSETLFKISSQFQTIHTPEAFFYQKTEEPTAFPKELPSSSRPLAREELLAALGSRPHSWLKEDEAPGPRQRVAGRIGPDPDPGRIAPAPNVCQLFPPPPGAPAPEATPALPRSPVKTTTVPPVISPERRTQDEESLWQEAIMLFSQERFDEAQKAFEDMAARNPQSARALLGLAFLHANLGAEEQSREFAESARQLDDLLPELYFLLALLDEKAGHEEQALKNYQRVILLDPDFAMARFNRANLLLKAGRRKEACREFNNVRAILERQPDNPSLRFSGGLSREAIIGFCRTKKE